MLLTTAAVATEDAEPTAPPVTPAAWSLAHRVAFRLGFLYAVLYCATLSSQVSGIDFLFGDKLDEYWSRFCALVAHRVLHLGGELRVAANGSGDRVVDWVGILLLAVAAAVGTIVWTLVSRQREHERLRGWLRVLLRYSVAFVLLGYGVSKVLKGQFPPPSPARLLQRFGDASPMGLLWAFMGASPAYVVFSGIGETVGAVLLLFRRTATLGALILAAVLTNVVMLNFCYDVPVKINSSHYLAMCIVLVLPDLRRLANVLVLQRPTAPSPWRRSFASRRARIAHHAAKAAVIVLVGGAVVFTSVRQVGAYRNRTRTWIDGYWKITRLWRNGQELPPLVDDPTRWARLKFESWDTTEYMRWHFGNGNIGPLFTAVVDEMHGRLTLTTAEKPDEKIEVPLTLQHPDAEHLRLAGHVDGADLVVEAERLRTDDMRLVSRGFHFVNEFPFNR